MNNFQAQVLEGLKEGDIIRSSVLDEGALEKRWRGDGKENPFWDFF